MNPTSARPIFSIVIAGALWSATVIPACGAPAAADEKLCQDYRKLLADDPLLPGANLSQIQDHSLDADYAKRSARLIQRTLGGRIGFESFHHLPFSVTLSDRKLEGNLMVFRFESEGKLRNYLSTLPEGSMGKRGILTAEAPQRFEAGASGNCLIILIVDGLSSNKAVDRLFDRFEKLVSVPAKE